MRRVLFLAFWLLVSFLSPVSYASRSYEAPLPEVTLASFNPVFAVARAQTAELIAQVTTDNLQAKSTYTFAAEAGDGITHLARKAVAEYLTDTNQADSFTRAEKVYLEDSLQNNIGTFGLALGQTESFARTDIESAVTTVKGIDTNSLEANLAKYVAKVDWTKYEKLDFSRSSESQNSDGTVDKNQDDSATTDNSGTDTDAAQTQNSNSNRTRTIVYIIIVVIILVIAGYLLFRGTDGEDSFESLLSKKDDKDESDNGSSSNNKTKQEAPKPVVAETKTETTEKSAPIPMKEGVTMKVADTSSKQDYTKTGNEEKK